MKKSFKALEEQFKSGLACGDIKLDPSQAGYLFDKYEYEDCVIYMVNKGFPINKAELKYLIEIDHNLKELFKWTMAINTRLFNIESRFKRDKNAKSLKAEYIEANLQMVKDD